MSYEPGVLVRRQQREYPPELRQEIALAALDVGNNREVARLYSERLGYTVNESTVRGIKKRYLEGVHKGKIDSPGISPRGGRDGGDRSSDGEDGGSIQPDQVMKLQLEVLEGKMKDSTGLEMAEDEIMDDGDMDDNITLVNGADALVLNDNVLNGDDSRDSSCNQLSIDIGGGDDSVDGTPSPAIKPTIRVARGLQKSPVISTERPPLITGGILAATLSGVKRKSSNGPLLNLGVTPLVKKARPSAAETDAEICVLEKEVKALQWLARRKEQEWDQAVRLLKQKEERLMRAQRCKVMIQAEAEHLLSKYRAPLPSLPSSPVVVPQQQVLILPSSRLIQPKPPMVTNTPTLTVTTKTPNIVTSPVVTTPPSPANSPTRRNSRSPGASVARQPTTTSTPIPTTTETTPGDTTPSVEGGVADPQETKFSSVLEKASKNLAKASGGGKDKKEQEKKNTPICQGCGDKKSEFVCAGCSNRWYCSRDCQVEDWDEHADDCSG